MNELREAVEQYINLGYSDPDSVATAVLASRGEKWVRERVDVALILRDMAVMGFARKRHQADKDRLARQELLAREEYRREQAKKQAEREEFKKLNNGKSRRQVEYEKRGGKTKREFEIEQRLARDERELQEKRDLGLSDDASAFEVLFATLKKHEEEIAEQAIKDFLASPLVRHHVPGEDGGTWKKRADLTADDCEAISESYMNRATTEAQEGIFFESLAKKMREEGVDIVSNLGPAIAA